MRYCAIIFETSDRIKIIVENHVSTIGSHKGNKQRLIKKYVVIISGMKLEILKYIQKCRNYQLIKLVHIKTWQPIVLTDTPGTAFNKVIINIMGSLPIIESGH